MPSSSATFETSAESLVQRQEERVHFRPADVKTAGWRREDADIAEVGSAREMAEGRKKS